MNHFRWFGILFAAMATFASGEPVVTIDERVEYPAGLIDRIKAEAGKQRPDQIRHIRIGRSSPFDPYGARVEYEPERYDTYAIARTLSVEIPGEHSDKIDPASSKEVYAFRMKAGPLDKQTLKTEIVRVFPLRTTTLLIQLQDNLSYDEVLSLLQAIENGKAQIVDNRKSWWDTLMGAIVLPELKLPSVSEFEKIECIFKDANGITISIYEGQFHGTDYLFQKKGDSYILVSIGSWVS